MFKRHGRWRRVIFMLAPLLCAFPLLYGASVRQTIGGVGEGESGCKQEPCFEIRRVESCQGHNCLEAAEADGCQESPCFALKQVAECKGDRCFQVFRTQSGAEADLNAHPGVFSVARKTRKSTNASTPKSTNASMTHMPATVQAVKQLGSCKTGTCFEVKQVKDCKAPPCFEAVKTNKCDGPGCFVVKKL
jgi:hypothetical protein